MFNFMATVTIYSDFGAQENKICHCFHFYLLLQSRDRKMVGDIIGAQSYASTAKCPKGH